MKKSVITALLTMCIVFGFAQQEIQYQLCGKDFSPLYMRHNLPENAIYRDTTASAAARAWDVLKRLNFNEKMELTGGWNNMHFPEVSRLGLRPIYFSDAGQGIQVRDFCVRVGKSTAFPCELALAATWDPKLAYTYARSIGEECRAWGISELLGPGLNMYRNSEGGRSFEYMGEDPLLTSAMGVQYLKGLQSTGTLATIKHFICNDEEFARHVVNVDVSERALREIYLPPFSAAIKEGGAMSLMNGHNSVNSYPAEANKPLLKDVLRKEYGYKGIIMTDWGNIAFWPEELKLILGSGQSLLMPDNILFAEYIQNEIKQHPEKKPTIEKGLDSMVFYNLYMFFKMNLYDRPYRDPSLAGQFESHKKVALKTAEEAITLLKNKDHILPIHPDKVNKIVVLGTEKALAASTGTGSGHVDGYDQVDYLTGLKNIYGNKIIYSKDITADEIKSADVVLYFISKFAGEGSDDPFDLPDSVNNNIVRCSHLNKNMIIIYSGGSGFSMPWLAEAKGLVFAYLLGQENGTALANIISGKVNPSGKLPFTIEKTFSQSPAYDYNKMNDGNYYWGGKGGIDRGYREKFGNITLSYKEGIYIGYRWYEKKKIQPQFPFGFGLSYTTFKISDVKLSSPIIEKDKPVMISFKVKNTGNIAGAEVTQLYVREVNPTVDRPVKELKGFERIFLNPGESETVSIPVDYHDLAFWNTKEHQWEVNPGKYQVEVGASSQSISQKVTISPRF